MKNFDEILNSTNWTEKINRSLSLNGHISEMLAAKDKALGMNSLADKVKNMNGLISNTSFSAIEAAQKSMSSKYSLSQSMIGVIDRSLSFQFGMSKTVMNEFSSSPSKRGSLMDAINVSNRFMAEVPQSVFDAVTSIGENHKKIIQSLSAALPESIGFRSLLAAHSNNLDISLRKLSGHIAARAAYDRNWKLIEDYKEVTEKTIEFTEVLLEESDKEINDFLQILKELVNTFVVKYKKFGKPIVDLFLIIIAVHPYIDFLKEKPELATKKDVSRIEKKLDSLLTSNSTKENNSLRITNRNCEIKLRPRMKSITIDRLKSGIEVIEITIHYKWVYISYFDSIDNLPKSGWVMKKYLVKP
ncbi:MAG TPA: hypothetical protein VGF79_08775 [Bacteroidia bacterium]